MMAAEAAMALAVDTKSLPGLARGGGVMSPAMGFGGVLIERLERHAGIKFDIVSQTSTAEAGKLKWYW
eukprot:CAMPEP_0196726040 /NCGR_PEP_ID=MMETSP1091-20130531/7424_1 /TAXON_ID=302021 /ORGANISM="Rhodomonas sp., Strain CCMP768" /LENGTH=67 /DNA_ID=CAMNT_0042068409 /DNA_START=22 /DNA_END=225 /DNA_ORIENTATION=+